MVLHVYILAETRPASSTWGHQTTSNARIAQHKEKNGCRNFTKRYSVTRLVYSRLTVTCGMPSREKKRSRPGGERQKLASYPFDEPLIS